METRSSASTKTNEWRLAASLVPPRSAIPTDSSLPLGMCHAASRFYCTKMSGKGSPSFAIPMSEGEGLKRCILDLGRGGSKWLAQVDGGDK